MSSADDAQLLVASTTAVAARGQRHSLVEQAVIANFDRSAI